MTYSTLDPDAIVDALVRFDGNRTHAARALGVTRVTLIRACHRLELWERIDAVSRRHGLPIYPRPDREPR